MGKKLDHQGLNRHLKSTSVKLKHHVLMTIVEPTLETHKKVKGENTPHTD